jgi:hypothetical protein
MLQVGFERKNPVFERAKTVYALDRAAIVIGHNQSQSHTATDGRSISKSWCRAPSGAHDQIFIIV